MIVVIADHAGAAVDRLPRVLVGYGEVVRLELHAAQYTPRSSVSLRVSPPKIVKSTRGKGD